MVYMWVYILDIYSSSDCSKDLTLYVYFTPFEKLLPTNQLTVFDSEHVNSGYTSGCKKTTEIVLYRKEEWFKVFIHETFHNFGLDFSDMNIYSIDKKLRGLYNVNIEYNLYESYCETWGRIIYTMMYSYFSLDNKYRNNFTYFNSVFKNNMKFEAGFSLYQAIKILDFMNLTFHMIQHKSNDCITSCNHLYREKTSVFSYYIITSLIMNNYIDFLSWCDKNNNSIIKFKKTPKNIDNYIEFISSCYNNKYVKNNIKNIELFLENQHNSKHDNSKHDNSKHDNSKHDNSKHDNSKHVNIRMTSIEMKNVLL